MTVDDARLRYVVRLGDNALVTGQRMIERVTAEPELEQELANANFALDYIGQARLFYSYAGELEGNGRGEDDFAYLRDAQDFENFLIAELPNGDFGHSIVRQFLFESWYALVLDALERVSDEGLAEIAARANKEIRYHLRHARLWLVRLGDGTETSHDRAQRALDELWPYTAEFFRGDAVDDALRDRFGGPDLAAIEARWRKEVTDALDEATLAVPDVPPAPGSGRAGTHSEHLGYLVAEMQHLKRAHPGANW